MSTLNKNNPIAKAVKYALLAGAGFTAFSATATFAAEEEDDEEDNTITVTGSRIKRTDIETAVPIISITAEDMEDMGRLTIADALRNSTSNSFGSFSEQSGSSAQSQATISLLGAGSNRTLILMDGKRLPGSPSLGGTAVNLNQIPMAMVERIDILKDGGSAIYGSDAVAGVINIITKKDYEGITISVGQGRPNLPGADSEEFSIVGGIASSKGNITFAFEHQEVDAVFDKDREYTRASKEDTNGDGIIQAYSETQGISFYGATVWNPNTGLAQASPECDNLTALGIGFQGVLGASAVFGPGEHTLCGFAYANVSANKASINRNSIMLNANYEINDDVEFFSRLMVTHNRSFGRYAPPAAPFPFIPVGNPHNPTNGSDNEVPTFGWFRWYQLGPRDNNIDDYTQDYLAGFRGSFGETAEYEVYYHYNHADNKSVGSTYLSYSGLYTNLYLGEPFDSEDGLSALAATTLNEDRNIFSQFYAGVGFDAGTFGDNTISHYIGGETYSIRYNSLVDKQSEGGWIGGSAGNSAFRDREVSAVFYETVIPVSDEIEVNFAIRRDDYSDFGSEVSPKISVRYQPTDDLLLRASWGEGFRAPTLSELSSADAFSAEAATDYFYCRSQSIEPSDCPSQQFTTTVQSNENLGAEESEFLNIGVVWTPVEDLTIRVDYADLTIDNAIGYVSVQDLIYMDLLGVTPPTGDVRLIRRPSGTIDEAFTGSQNGAGLNIVSLDVEVSYMIDTEIGRFNLDTTVSTMLEYNTDLFFGGPQQDLTGFSGAPERRISFTSRYSNGDHNFAWNMDFIASTGSAVEPTVNATSGLSLSSTGTISSLLIHNVNYSYDAGDWGRYTLGVRNVTNEKLPTTTSGAQVYSSSLYTPAHLGRTIYVNATIEF